MQAAQPKRWTITRSMWRAFEGMARAKPGRPSGQAKEKRSASPLVTLALVLDAAGSPKRREAFAGKASEPGTLAAKRSASSCLRSEPGLRREPDVEGCMTGFLNPEGDILEAAEQGRAAVARSVARSCDSTGSPGMRP
jgi:hypothetical protein